MGAEQVVRTTAGSVRRRGMGAETDEGRAGARWRLVHDVG